VDARDADDHTALHWAAYVGHAEITRVLINHGADMIAKDNRGMIPLHWAAAKVPLSLLLSWAVCLAVAV
jgi:ankyrin repeat protein